MKATVIIPPRRAFYDPGILLNLYRWMAEYEQEFRCKPAIEDVAYAFGISSSVTRYYLDRMAELGMGFQPKVIRPATGNVITPPRSFILLPLKQAHETVKTYLEKE